MIKIKTDNIEFLKDAVESLACQLACLKLKEQHNGMELFEVSEEEVITLIEGEGLDVEKVEY